MAKKKKFYITTALPYVNAAPHVGFAFELIATDVIARWHRLLKEDVFFLTGTDENAKKNEVAAREAGIPVTIFVNENAKTFMELCKRVNASNDDFIRTTETRHVKVAKELFNLIYKKKDIYKATYKGIYCVGCEAFLTKKDLVDGKCPEHNKEPEFIEEESYFFKLSKYAKDIEKSLNKKGFVIPEERRKEILSRLKEEKLQDLSVSRINQKWGIDVPIDKKHKIYVWIDALSNYISALGWPTGEKFKKYWPADLHVIGKGINWFHSVIWQSLLLSAGIVPPKQIFVHGYLTVNGKKISKSLGNAIDPTYIITKYGADSLRYFLIRNIPFGQDGDFSEEALKARHNNELADKLGNLVSRVAGLIEKKQEGKIVKTKIDNALVKRLKFEKINQHMQNYEIDKALAEIFSFIDECNLYVQEKKPWQLQGKELHDVLYTLADSLRVTAILLYPFIPETAEKIAAQFNFEIKSLDDCKFGLLKENKIKKAEILFKKIE